VGFIEIHFKDRLWDSPSLLSKKVPGAINPEVKWPGHEADRLAPCSAEVKNAWGYTSTPHTSLWHVVLNMNLRRISTFQQEKKCINYTT
jgi:hypothetical protein